MAESTACFFDGFPRWDFGFRFFFTLGSDDLTRLL